MRVSRKDTLSGQANTLLISCRLHDDAPTLGWNERAILQTFIRELHEPGVTETLTWCILPRSYRFLLRGHDDQSPATPAGLRLVSAKMRSLQMRFRQWREYQGISAPLWKDRFKSSPLPGPGQIRAAAASIDGMPGALQLVDEPDDYYFCGYHHAANGDPEIRDHLGKVLGTSTWAATNRTYRKLLRQFASA